MRRLAAVVSLLTLLAAVPSAHAGWWPFGGGGPKNETLKKKMPKAIDHPIVRPKVKESHKSGKRAGDHPEHMRQH